MPSYTIPTERETLHKEINFFNTREDDITPGYVGVLTTSYPATVSVLYPQFAKGALTVYDQIESPVDPNIARRFIFRYLAERLLRGELISDADVKKLTEEVREGVYLRQLTAYGAYLDETSKAPRRGRLEADADIENRLLRGIFGDSASRAFREYRTINTENDILYNKRLVLARLLAMKTGVQAVHGNMDFPNVLLTELLLDAPFVETAVISNGVDERGCERHEAYLREIFEFARTFDPSKRFTAFEQLSEQYKTEWTEEVRPPKVIEFDRAYLLELYKFAKGMANGWNIQDLYGIFQKTVLRRGKLFKAHVTKDGVEIVPTELPSVSFDDIGGYEEQKGFYRTLLERTKKNDPIVGDVRIVLSSGRPGVGKSLGVLAFLNNLPDNAKGVVFEYERTLTDQGVLPELDSIIRLARLHPELHLYSVIEDIDALTGNRLVNPMTRKFLEIDSAIPGALPNNLHLIANTNRPDMIDPAVIRPGRTSKILVYDTPDEKTRREIAGIHARRNGFTLSDQTLDTIAKKTNDYTPDEIRHVVWSLKFEGINNPLDADIDRYVAEIRRKHKIEKEAAGFKTRKG